MLVSKHGVAAARWGAEGGDKGLVRCDNLPAFESHVPRGQRVGVDLGKAQEFFALDGARVVL